MGFPASNARVSPGLCQGRSVPMFPVRSVGMFPVSSARMCQDRSVKMFLASSAIMFQDKSPGRSVPMFPGSSARMFLASSARMSPSRSVRMFLASNARMFPASSASRCPSRSVTLLSPLMAMENRQRAFSKRINPKFIFHTRNNETKKHIRKENNETKIHFRKDKSAVTPSPFPPNFTNVEDRNYSQYSSQPATVFILNENHIYFMALIF